MRTITELLQGAALIGDMLDNAKPSGADIAAHKEAAALGIDVAKATKEGAPRGLMAAALMELIRCKRPIPAFIHAFEGELYAQLRKELH